MSTLSEKFADYAMRSGSMVPFFREMAQAVDEIEARFAHMRAAGETVPKFVPPDHHGYHARMLAANGQGDVLNTVRDMARWCDEVKEWIEARDATETTHSVGQATFASPMKRGPGRPRKDAA